MPTTPRARRHRVVIVGAGAAGCVVAATLANAEFDVTLVEGGPDRNPDDATAPVNSGDLFRAATARQYVYEAAATAGAGEPTRPYLRGVGIGGSGSINGLLLHRGTPEDYERWAALPGCDGWDSGELWPRVQRRYDRGRTHERRGPVDALLAASLPVEPARFAIDATGRRACSATTDLDPVRRQIDVRTDAPVRRVLIEHGRCGGVELDSRETIDADLVVVCAGALQSPLLLQRSGVDRPGIGANLHDHPAIGVAVPLFESTPLDIAPTTVVAHLTSGGSHPHLQVLPLNRIGIDDHDTRAGALLIGVLEQYGRGRIRREPDGSVTLDFNQNNDERDRAAARLAAAFAHRILATHPGIEHVPSPDEPPEVTDAWVATHRGEYLHAAGTCRMGSVDDDGAVVDNTCQVIATPGLYVVDASIFPNQPRTNPYLATLAVAELAAERIAAIWSTGS